MNIGNRGNWHSWWNGSWLKGSWWMVIGDIEKIQNDHWQNGGWWDSGWWNGNW